MENLGTYFLIALAIAFVIYYSKKKNTSTPKGKAPSKPRTAAASKPSKKKGGQGPKKGEKTTGTSSELSSSLGTSKGKESANTSNLSEFDLMAAQAIQSMGKGDSKSLAPNQAPRTHSAPPNFDLESEVKQLQSRTGWDYAKAKAYCEQALQYQSKVGKPTRLKNS